MHAAPWMQSNAHTLHMHIPSQALQLTSQCNVPLPRSRTAKQLDHALPCRAPVTALR